MLDYQKEIVLVYASAVRIGFSPYLYRLIRSKSSQNRFWQHMCMAAKVEGTVLTAKEALKAGKCIVIGLQNTGLLLSRIRL